MKITEQNVFDVCKYEKENSALDFKQKYSKENTKNIIKDIMSFANGHTFEEKNIVIGVKEGIEENNILGVDESLDTSTIENIIHANIEPDIMLTVNSFFVDEKLVNVIAISQDNFLKRPFLMKKQFQNFHEGQGFIRRGASNRNLIRDDLIKMQDEHEKNGNLSLKVFDEHVINIDDKLKEISIEIDNLVREIQELVSQSCEEQVDDTVNELYSFSLDKVEDFKISELRAERLKDKVNCNIETIVNIPHLKGIYKMSFGMQPGRYLERVYSVNENSQKAYSKFCELEKKIGLHDLYSYFNGYEVKTYYIEATTNVENIEIRIRNFIPNDITGTATKEIIDQLEYEFHLNKAVGEVKEFRREVDPIKEQYRQKYSSNMLNLYVSNNEKNIEDLYNSYEPFDNVEYFPENEELIFKLSLLRKDEKMFFPYKLLMKNDMSFHVSSSCGELTGLIQCEME